MTNDPACNQVIDACATSPATDAAGSALGTEALETQRPDGTWAFTGQNCAVANAPPQVTGEMARAEAQKLVPHPGLGIAPPGGRSLVNVETVLWVDTPPDQALATVTLLGQAVALRIHLQRVDWNFGDGQTASTDSAETAYSTSDPCDTKLCDDYWGHVYTTAGQLTVSAQLTWTGDFAVDGGGWQPIAGTVTAPTQTRPLRVLQEHTILVTAPGQR